MKRNKKILSEREVLNEKKKLKRVPKKEKVGTYVFFFFNFEWGVGIRL